MTFPKHLDSHDLWKSRNGESSNTYMSSYLPVNPILCASGDLLLASMGVLSSP